MIFGTAELVDSLPALTMEQMPKTQNFHGIPDAEIQGAMENGWNTPWVLRDVVRFETPKPYVHPSGAITWVGLPDEITEGADQGHVSTKPRKPAKAVTTPTPPATKVKPEPVGKVTQWIDIQLSGGNIRNGHFSLRSAAPLLPRDCIGGSNKDQAGTNIQIRFEPGMLVETDIAGDKMILRSRGQVREFFDRTGAKEGDWVRFGRVADHSFVVTLRRAD